MATSVGKPKARAARWPWVTHAVILACVGVFLVTYLPSRATIAESEAKVKQAAYYFVGHPYLNAEPRLLTAVGQRIAREARAAYLDDREQSGAAALPEATVRHQQAKLEAMLVQADTLRAALPYGDWGVVPARFDRKTLGTYAFLHGSWLHLSIVALFILLLGSALEGSWGRPLYGTLLAGSTLAAGTWYALELRQVEIPLIGGSGLAAGLLGAFLVAFWGRREDFIYGVGTIAGLFWLVIPLWAGDRFFGPPGERASLGLSPPSFVQWAHLGGFLFGAGLALVVRWADVRRRAPRHGVDKRLARGSEAVRDRALLDRAMRARRSGEIAESFALLRQVLKIQPNHLEASRALWDAAVALDKAHEGAPALISALRQEVRAQDSEAVVRHWLELLDYAGGTQLEAALLIEIARFVQIAGHRVEAREALRRALRDPTVLSSSTLALRIVEGARGLDAELTLAAARIARDVGGSVTSNGKIWSA